LINRNGFRVSAQQRVTSTVSVDAQVEEQAIVTPRAVQPIILMRQHSSALVSIILYDPFNEKLSETK